MAWVTMVNEFKVITQVFLYKYMNDKFAFELKKLDFNLKNAENLSAGQAGWRKP
jgi:type I restriction enzyme M protein